MIEWGEAREQSAAEPGDGDTQIMRKIASIDHRGGDFRYIDSDVEQGREYTYRIGVDDRDGEFLSPSGRATIPVTAAELKQNSPNPFNPVTTISFVLQSAQQVKLTIFDTNGRLVRTLVNDVRTAGSNDVTWDGTNDVGQTVASGVYVYRIQTGRFQQSKKMVLLK